MSLHFSFEQIPILLFLSNFRYCLLCELHLNAFSKSYTATLNFSISLVFSSKPLYNQRGLSDICIQDNDNLSGNIFCAHCGTCSLLFCCRGAYRDTAQAHAMQNTPPAARALRVLDFDCFGSFACALPCFCAVKRKIQ